MIPLLRPSLADMLRLALPSVAIQVGMMSMGVVDTMMMGRVSAAALAAAALGNMYFFALAVFGMGVIMATALAKVGLKSGQPDAPGRPAWKWSSGCKSHTVKAWRATPAPSHASVAAGPAARALRPQRILQ